MHQTFVKKVRQPKRTVWEVKHEPIGGGGILNGLYQRIALSTPRRTSWKTHERSKYEIERNFVLKTSLEWKLDLLLAASSFSKTFRVTSRTTEQGFDNSRNLGQHQGASEIAKWDASAPQLQLSSGDRTPSSGLCRKPGTSWLLQSSRVLTLPVGSVG